MKSGGAITSTRDTASFFSCKWPVKGRVNSDVRHVSLHYSMYLPTKLVNNVYTDIASVLRPIQDLLHKGWVCSMR